MTITEFSEVAVPIVGQPIEDSRQIVCHQCFSTMLAIHIAENAYRCVTCNSPVCVMCGCTEERACIGGCHWLSPGICSSHQQELSDLAARVFAGLKP